MTVIYVRVCGTEHERIRNQQGICRKMMTTSLSTVSAEGFLIISSFVPIVRASFMSWFCSIHSLSTVL